jgi:menaquinone-dependent protoporphyrinogen oxidase
MSEALAVDRGTVLVAYASRHGSTREIAETIASQLESDGLRAIVRRVDEVGDLDAYDAIVIGSAVYAGSWMREATRCLERASPRTARVPTWLFSSGPIDDSGKHGVSEAQQLALNGVHAVEHRVFGGRLDVSQLGFVERRIVKLVGATDADHRSWDDIRAFADDIASACAPRPDAEALGTVRDEG